MNTDGYKMTDEDLFTGQCKFHVRGGVDVKMKSVSHNVLQRCFDFIQRMQKQSKKFVKLFIPRPSNNNLYSERVALCLFTLAPFKLLNMH